jgi:hypothetical protein
MTGDSFNRSYARALIHREQKPTVPEVMELVWDYYEIPGVGCGGSLHIVLDDDNVEDHHVEFCQRYAEDHGDHEGELLAQILLRMSKTQRLKVAGLVYPRPGEREEYLARHSA